MMEKGKEKKVEDKKAKENKVGGKNKEEDNVDMEVKIAEPEEDNVCTFVGEEYLFLPALNLSTMIAGI